MSQPLRIPSFPTGRGAKAAEAAVFGKKGMKPGQKPDLPVLIDRQAGAYRIVRIGATKISDQWVITSMVDPRVIFQGVWIFHSISLRNADSQVSEPSEIYLFDASEGGNGALSLETGLTSEYQKLHWVNGSQMMFRGTWIPRCRVYCSTENVNDLFYMDVIAEKLVEGV